MTRSMSDFILWKFVICCILTNKVTCQQEQSQLWENNSTLSNVVCPNAAINVKHARSVTHCGMMCTSSTDCSSFIYFPSTSIVEDNCYMYEQLIDSAAGCTSKTNAAYFHRLYMYTTFQCHPDDGEYRTFQLSDRSLVTYRVVHSMVTHTVAKADCEATGGSLLKLSTVPRIDMIYELLTTCPEFTLRKGYYVDGENGNADLTWTWSDGDVIPMNSTFWIPGFPNAPATEHCVHIRLNEYLLDDAPCVYTLSYICEKPSP